MAALPSWPARTIRPGSSPRRTWMRHALVRQALVDGLRIEVVRQLAGHAASDTTSIYSTQALASKVKAVQVTKRRLAA